VTHGGGGSNKATKQTGNRKKKNKSKNYVSIRGVRGLGYFIHVQVGYVETVTAKISLFVGRGWILNRIINIYNPSSSCRTELLYIEIWDGIHQIVIKTVSGFCYRHQTLSFSSLQDIPDC
jgi:hypothetical protein